MPAPASISQWFIDDVAKPPAPTLTNDFSAMGNGAQVSNFFGVHTAGGVVRGRMMYALGRFLIASERNGGIDKQFMWTWQRMFYLYALGNFKDLIRAMTYRSTVQAVYLTYLGSTNLAPDENYARELIQLYTLGLFQRRPDGSFILDQDGNRIETYDPFEDVAELARSMTGGYFPRLQDRFDTSIRPHSGDHLNYIPSANQDPTLLRFDFNLLTIDGSYASRSEDIFWRPTEHDFGARTLFGTVIPDATPPNLNDTGDRDQIPNSGGTTGDPDYRDWHREMSQLIRDDIDRSLDVIFAQPWFGPHVVDRLLKPWNASNATPGRKELTYNAFETGRATLPDGREVGSGQQGDLVATAAAILFHPEARGTVVPQGNRPFGKVRHGAEMCTHLIGLYVGPDFDYATNGTQSWWTNGTSILFDGFWDGQFGYDTSVFADANADASPPATELSLAGYLSPELSIVTEASRLVTLRQFSDMAARINWSDTVSDQAIVCGLGNPEQGYLCDSVLTSWAALSDIELRDRVNFEMLRNTATPETIQEIDDHIAAWTANTSEGLTAKGKSLTRVRAAIMVAACSLEFMVIGD